MNSTRQTNKFTRFLRNHAALLLLIFCVIAIATVVLAVTLTREPTLPDNPVGGRPDDNPDSTEPAVKEKVKVYFDAPVKFTSIGMHFTDDDTMFVFNASLGYWATHDGIDLLAAEGTEVVAMYDGVVIDIDETFGKGNYVTVDHGDNVIVTYASLGDVDVLEGQRLTKGEHIGTVSASAADEHKQGSHLHIEVVKNDQIVNPLPYIDGEIYREIDAD